jgi:hypothetical protein
VPREEAHGVRCGASCSQMCLVGQSFEPWLWKALRLGLLY